MPETCGDHGGETEAGDPCGKPEGWGTDLDTGRCRHHPVQDGPPIPEGLPESARKHWRQIIREMDPVDVPLAVQAARYHQVIRETDQKLQAEGYVLDDAAHGGGQKKHPAWTVHRQAAESFRKICNQIDWPENPGEPVSEIERIMREQPREKNRREFN